MQPKRSLASILGRDAVVSELKFNLTDSSFFGRILVTSSRSDTKISFYFFRAFFTLVSFFCLLSFLFSFLSGLLSISVGFLQFIPSLYRQQRLLQALQTEPYNLEIFWSEQRKCERSWASKEIMQQQMQEE